MIKLVVGLGNPGLEYADTRHNVGFWAIDLLAKHLGARLTSEHKYFGESSRVKCGTNEIWLLKPLTYMNLSGKSLQPLASFFKITPSEILVIHDELDFAPGVIKIKQGGGHAGHNGLKDIDRVIGREYWRLRIGIGHPGHADKVAKFVLSRPSLDEKIEIEHALAKFIQIIDSLINGNIAYAQKYFHSR